MKRLYIILLMLCLSISGIAKTTRYHSSNFAQYNVGEEPYWISCYVDIIITDYGKQTKIYVIDNDSKRISLTSNRVDIYIKEHVTVYKYYRDEKLMVSRYVSSGGKSIIQLFTYDPPLTYIVD